MRYSFRTFAAPVAVVLLAGSTDLMAQVTRPKTPTNNAAPNNAASNNAGPKQAQAPAGGQRQAVVPASGQRPAQPEGAPVRPAAPPRPVHNEQSIAKRDQVLELWEARSSKIKSLTGKHTRKTFNTVFEEERVAKGKFYLETPDKGRIDLDGVKPGKNVSARKNTKTGAPYRLVEDQSERWICNGQEIVMVNEADKSYEILPIPADQRGENIIHSPLPFLFGMKADDARERFEIFVGQINQTEIYLTVFPIEAQDRANYTKAQIILDRATFLPKSVRLFDPAGSQETEYDFESIKVNEKGILEQLGWESKPFHPDLRKQGYKIVVHPPAKGAGPADVPRNVSSTQNKK